MAIGEYTLEAKITIDRTPDEVFAFVADAENDPQWCVHVPEVTKAGDNESGLARYEFVQSMGPARIAGIIEYLSNSPPFELSSVAKATGAMFESSYRLEPSNGGTVLTHTKTAHWNGLIRLTHPVQKAMGKRIQVRQLVALKTILESR